MSDQPRTTSARRMWIIGASVVVLLAGAIGIGVATTRSAGSGAHNAAVGLARAMQDKRLSDTSFVGASGADVQATFMKSIGTMGPTPLVVSVGNVTSKGNAAVAALHVSWNLGGGQWAYDTSVDLRKIAKQWSVQWTPAVLQPQLTASDMLSLSRTQPTRGNILGLDGSPIVQPQPVVRVGVQPNRTTDVDGLSAQLAALLHIDGNDLASRVKAAKPDAFVDVITLRDSDYQPLKAALQPLPGTVFQQATLPLAPTRLFASALLGRVGPVTAEIVDKSNGRYQAGDNAGLSGLEQQYDDLLTGKPGAAVSIEHADGTSVRVFAIDPVAGSPLQTTIDARTQQAADDALSGQTKPSSFVAVKVSTGQVLAVANGPDAGGADRALTGQYPPGSSFKVITSYTLLQGGLSTNDQIACPATATVDGRTFKNAEDEAFGSAPFHVDFAKSCNTAFVGLSSRLQNDSLPTAAKAFGLMNEWQLGTNAFSGSVPAADTKVELAADAFGQGKLLVSPLAMANVAAGVARGTSVSPSLVNSPGDHATSQTAGTLDSEAIDQLRTLMREVVTSGTGTALASVPGDPVYGKTGTAEFGTADPPQSHAWFMGYQGDIAFAAFVEGGEFGGDTAAPIAAKFLRAINAG